MTATPAMFASDFAMPCLAAGSLTKALALGRTILILPNTVICCVSPVVPTVTMEVVTVEVTWELVSVAVVAASVVVPAVTMEVVTVEAP